MMRMHFAIAPMLVCDPTSNIHLRAVFRRRSFMKPGIEELSDNMRKLLEDAEALLEGTANGAGAKLDKAGRNAREGLQRVCGHLRDAKDEVSSRARKVDSAVHSHPWQALATTAAVAFIAGLLVRRR